MERVEGTVRHGEVGRWSSVVSQRHAEGSVERTSSFPS